MTRIGIVTEYYDPEGGSAAVPGFIARSLVKRGMEVEVLTGFPNYPEGRIYPGYSQRFRQRELMEGVVVHRVPLYPSHNNRTWQRVASYTSFAASSALGIQGLRHCDAILVYSTPVTVGLGSAIKHVLSEQPVVTMIQDLWPETLLHSGFSGQGLSWRIAQSLAKSASDAIYRRSDAISVISPGMADALALRGIPREKISVIYNWLPPEIFTSSQGTPSDTGTQGLAQGFRVIYAGNLGEPQSVRTIIDAASILRHRSDIRFMIVGSGVLERELHERVTRESLGQVEFLGVRPMSEIAGLVAQSDAQLVTLAPSPIFDMTIPSKLQFSLGFGKAIIAAVGGDPASIAEESGAAIVCAPGSGMQLANAIVQAAELPKEKLQFMGARGKEFFNRNFSEEVGASALDTLLSSVIDRSNYRKATKAN